MKNLYVVNKNLLINTVSKKVDKDNKEISEIVNCMLDVIRDSLKEGNRVDIAGFGSFDLIQRKSHTGINPITKEKIIIPATKTPKFKPSVAFKNKINSK